MRILHTSDWHLGRSLHGADLELAQATFLEHLVDVVRSEGVDVVAVAGDIYDRAIPPVQAVRMLERVLAKITEAGAKVVAISGNHDSPARLGFGSELLSQAGVFLRTSPVAVADPIVLDGVAFYCIPYLEPLTARVALADDDEEIAATQAAVTSAAITIIRADAASHALPSVVLAHGWVTGGAGCESERPIEINGFGTIPTSLFDGFDYVALGHLHGQQDLDAHLRYSGSPLAYSFSEAAHTKGSMLIDLGPGGVRSVTQVAAPVHRALVVLSGEVDTLLASNEHSIHEASYVSVIATDTSRPLDAMERLRQRFPHVLSFQWRAPVTDTDLRSYGERVAGRSDLDLALDFVEHVRSSSTPAERELLQEAFAAGLALTEDARMAEALSIPSEQLVLDTAFLRDAAVSASFDEEVA